MIIKAECYKVLVRGQEGNSSRYAVEFLGLNRLAFLDFSPEKHGEIDPRFIEVSYQVGDLEKNTDAPERPDVGGYVFVHVAPRCDHVFRWQKVPTETSIAA